MKELVRCRIAGVGYHNYQEAVAKGLRRGSVLDLFWEKENPFDPLAIRVEWKKIKLGYIPANTKWQTDLHNARDTKNKVTTTLVNYNPANPTYSMFIISCTVKEEKDTKF